MAALVRSMLPFVVAFVVAASLPKNLRAAEPPSLVYLDTSRQGTTDVWLISADGGSRRLAATLSGAARPLDLRDTELLVAMGTAAVHVDLLSGLTTTVPIGARVASGLLTAQHRGIFTTRAGCGPVDSKTRFGRLDFEAGTATDAGTADAPGLEALWYQDDTGELLGALRGCDPGVSTLVTLNVAAGTESARIPVAGCGWVATAPDGRQALISFAFCGGGDFPELNVYSLPDGTRREVRFAKDAPSRHPFTYAPDGSAAAFGLALARDNPSGAAKSGGIWLLNTSDLTTRPLWQDSGQEAWAVDWSEEGTFIVAASVEAQSRCGYFVIDVASQSATRVEGLTGCGTDGTLVGFADAPTTGHRPPGYALARSAGGTNDPAQR
ncbi:MAG: hypothetical protein U0821_15995 [Chloroflexota bacterium]